MNLIITICILFTVPLLFAQNGVPKAFNIQGTIYQPASNNPFVGTANIRFQILNQAGTCVMYSETVSGVDTTNTNGVFSVDLGTTANRVNNIDSTTTLGINVFKNNVTHSSVAGCAGAIVIAANETRKIRISFDVGSGYSDMTPDIEMLSAPYAMIAETLDGHTTSEFIMANTSAGVQVSQVNLETLLNNITKFNTLNNFATTGDITGNAATATIASTVSNGAITAAKLAQMGAANGQIMKWDGSTWVASNDNSGVATITSTDVTTALGYTPVSTAGTVANSINFSGNLSGDVSGTQSTTTVDSVGGKTSAQIATSVNDTVSATNANTASTIVKRDGSGNIAVSNLSATNVSSTNNSIQNLYLFDSTNTNQILFKAPNAGIINYTLTLPPTVGTNGQVLSTNASGDLSWTNASSGSVTSVTSVNSDITISNTTSTPQLTLNAAVSGANKILRLDGSGKIDSSTVPTNILTTATTLSGDVSGTSTTTSVDKIKGTPINAAAPTASGQVLRYDGSQWVPNFIAMTDLRSSITGANAFASSCGANQTLTYNSVGDVMTCSNIAISLSQISGLANSASVDTTNASNIASGTLSAARLPTSVTDGLWTANASGDVSRVSGNVGIGTTTPLRPLHVAVSSAGANTLLGLENKDVTDGNGIVLSFRGTTTGVGAAPFTELAGIRSVFNTHDHATRDANLQFFTSGSGIITHKMTILGNGNIGIGTTSPNYKFVVSDASNDGNGYLGFSYASTDAFKIGRNNITGFLDFTSLTGANSYGYNFLNGNVGIGTTTPTGKLSISSSDGTVSSAPLKLTAGINLVTPEDGAMEFDGTNLYFTSGGTRRTLASSSGGTLGGNISAINNTGGSITMTPSAGNSVIVNQTTSSTNSTSGALIVNGGVGIVENLNVGGNIVGSGTISAQTSMLSPLLYGSSVSSGDLTLDSTSHGTKGNIILAPTGGNVGVGATNPGSNLHIENTGTVVTKIRSTDAVGVGRSYVQLLRGTSGVTENGWDISSNDSLANDELTFRQITNGVVSKPVTFLKNGNVGLGTTNPSAPLQINAANADPNAQASNLFITASDTAAIDKGGSILLGGSYTGTTQTNWAAIAGRKENASAGDYAGYLNFYTRANGGVPVEKMRITSSGNVGIGTTSPTTLTEINTAVAASDSSSGAKLKISGNGNTGFSASEIQLYDRSADHNWNLGMRDYSDDGSFRVSKGTFGNNTSDYLIILPSGSIGIGTETPSNLLSNISTSVGYTNVGDNSGVGQNSSSLSWASAANGYTAAIVNASSSVSANGLQVRTAGVGSSNKILSLGTGTASAANTDLFVVQGDGNVGIGTTSPSYPLDVKNQIRVGAQGGLDVSILNGGAGYGANLDLYNVSGTLTTKISANNNSYFNFGSVGIGTTNPQSKLDVRGSVIAANTDFVNGATGSFVQIQQGAATGNTYSSIGAYQAGGVSSNSLILQNAGGNVGIGTTAPAAKLDVANATIRALDSNTQYPPASGKGLEMLSLSGVGYIFEYDRTLGAYGPLRLGGSNLQFETVGGERMRIDSSGNVGIGNTSPLEKLNVTGTISTSYSDTNYPKIRGQIYNSGDSGGLTFAAQGASNTTNGSGDIRFVTGDANSINVNTDATLTEKMRIKYNGYVGIGTTSPQGALDISSTTSSFIPPRMTTAQRDAMTSVQDGSIIYNNTTNKLNIRENGVWNTLGTSLPGQIWSCPCYGVSHLVASNAVGQTCGVQTTGSTNNPELYGTCTQLQ